MIANSQTGASFSGSVGYITSESAGTTEEGGVIEKAKKKVGLKEERVSATKTRNLLFEDDLEAAAKEMQVTAGARERVEKPVYSISIGYHPDDDPTDQEMLRDMEDFLERRGLGEHQAVLAVHRDKEHPHVHATVNRVHPSGEELWRDSFDRLENMSVLREIERERGWTRPEQQEDQGRVADWKLRKFERTGELPFGQEVQAQAGDAFAESESWSELQERLAAQGLQVQENGSGGRVTDGEESAPLSEVARAWSFNKLDSRFPDQFTAHERTQAADERGGREAAGAARGPEADSSGSERDRAEDHGPEGRGRAAGSGRSDEDDRGGYGGGRERRRHGQQGRKDVSGEARGPGDDQESRRRGGRSEGGAQEREGEAVGGVDREAHDRDGPDLDSDWSTPLDYGGSDPLSPSVDEDEREGDSVDRGGEIRADGPERAGERESRSIEGADRGGQQHEGSEVEEPVGGSYRVRQLLAEGENAEAARVFGRLDREDQERLSQTLTKNLRGELRKGRFKADREADGAEKAYQALSPNEQELVAGIQAIDRGILPEEQAERVREAISSLGEDQRSQVREALPSSAQSVFEGLKSEGRSEGQDSSKDESEDKDPSEEKDRDRGRSRGGYGGIGR